METIEIRWYVVPNRNTTRGGYMPMISVNGREHGDTYGRGYDRTTAEAWARLDAKEEANRYRGDFKVTIAEMITTTNPKP